MSQGVPRNSLVIGERYRLERQLGRGGMGTVWQATDELLARKVAVKELHVDDGTKATGALREARVVAQLRHPHVVVVHDVVDHEGHPYIVMELVEGGSLADRLAGGGPLPPGEAARLGVALLGALGAAHAGGVLHRDVKPANVLMEAGTGRVVLTDFGIARLAGATTISESGAFVGSPEYTAPERMRGGEAGPASDLWSLGALLCAAVTGESPFHRDSIGGVLHAVVFDEIRPPARLGPLLPVVRGLLERDPARRLGAAEAARLLAACVPAGGTAGAPTGTAPLTVRSTGADPAAVTGAGVAAEGGPVVVCSPADRVPAPVVATATTTATARRGGRGLRTGLLAVLVAGAAAGAVVTGAALLDRTAPGASEGTTAGALGTPRSGAGSAKPSGAPGTAGAAGTTGSTGSTGVAVPRSPAGSARTVPPGYRFTPDPAGFAVAVPDGFLRSTDGQRVFYVSADQALRIGIRVRMPVPGGPLSVMRQSDRSGPGTNPGYRDAEVVATTHNALPAAVWEFTWDGFSRAEGARHTIDVCWEEDARLYDVWVSAPVGRLPEARSHFDAVLDSFVATRAD
ncbi:serine/threonine-protein kinase [Streptomyces sp. NPDC002073]